MEPYPCQDNPPDKHRDAQLNSLCEAMGKAEGILGAQGGFPAQGSDEGTQPHKKPRAPWARRAGRAGGRVPSLLSEAQQAHESQQGGWIGAPQGTTGAKHLDHPQGCSGTPLSSTVSPVLVQLKTPPTQEPSHTIPALLFPELPALTSTGSLHPRHTGVLAPQKTWRKGQPWITGG